MMMFFFVFSRLNASLIRVIAHSDVRYKRNFYTLYIYICVWVCVGVCVCIYGYMYYMNVGKRTQKKWARKKGHRKNGHRKKGHK